MAGLIHTICIVLKRFLEVARPASISSQVLSRAFLLFSIAVLSACQLDMEMSEPTYSAKLDMIKDRAKADGQDAVRFQVTVVNQKLQRPAENINVQILVNGEPATSHHIECSRTNSQGLSLCQATSELWSLVYLEADLGEKKLSVSSNSLLEEQLFETPERKEALFYDIYSYMQETTAGSLTAYADTLLSAASVSIFILDSQNEPIEGMNPIIKLEGPGATTHTCTASDVNGEAICLIYGETPGTYSLTSETPRLADPLSLTFLSRTRSCTALPNAHAYEVWGDSNDPSWGTCTVSGCFSNYSMSPDGNCVADVRSCLPFPVGATNATQTWEEAAAGAWGGCLITACALNYTLTGAGPGNSCVANTRDVVPGDLPPHAETAEETWNGGGWDPPYITSCHYPYKAVAGSCVPLDVLPDAFVILNKVYQNLNEIIYSAAIQISGIETVVKASVSGDPTAFIEKKSLGESDWLPFNSETDYLRNGDEFRLGLLSSSQIDTTSTVSYSVGAMGPLTWTVTTRDSNPPSDFQVSHANNQKDFSLAWNVAGVANQPRTCAIEFQINASTWTAVATGIDCDSTLPLTALTLPASAGFSTYFDSNGISLRVRRSDGVVLANLSQKLRCFADPFVPNVDDPSRDENCNANWTDDGDLSPPVGGFFSIAEDPLVTRPLVTLNIICPTDLEGSSVQVAYAETNPPTNWESCSTTKSMILAGDGLRTIYVRFKDASNNATAVDSKTIMYDSSQPIADGSFVINGGQPYTRQTSSVLNVFCPTEIDGASPQVAWGSSSSPGDPLEPTDWAACATSLPYALSIGDGVKIVYMRFKGDLGTVSDTTSSSIILDETAPISSISYFNGWRTDSSIAVNVSASDALSGIDHCDLQISQAPLADGVVGTFSAWSTVSTMCSAYSTNGVSGAAYRFRIRAADRAGNVSDWFEPAEILRINMEPPYGGSISYSNTVQTTTAIAVSVDRGLDSYSGMSSVASDYQLQVSFASLNPSTLSCGVFGAFTDAGVIESPAATAYSFSGVQGSCYKFQYQVRNSVGIVATYSSVNVTKINYTYAWNIGAYGVCNGGTGTWNYGNWGACTGGTGTWNYTAWTSCTASCGGGTQTRTTTCQVNPNTAAETRSATCDKVALSGLQNRSVTCRRSDGATVADTFCAGTKAPTQQSCTPTSDSVCGAVVNSRSCTNNSDSVCGAQAPLQQSCKTQPCCSSAGGTNLCPGATFSSCNNVKYYCAQAAPTYCASRSASDVTSGYIRCGGKGQPETRTTCRCN